MKCFVCGNDTPGEVCNQCVRTEKSIFHKEWDYKEGFIVKKVESYKLDVTSYRITGTGMVSNSDKGLNGRVDTFNHYIGNVDFVQKGQCNGKDALVIHYKNQNTQMERYIHFQGFTDDETVKNAINAAKAEASSGAGAGGGVSADVEGKLRKLQVLLESGILTADEYEKEKAKVLKS